MAKSDGWSYYLICSFFFRDKKKVFQWPHHALAYRNVHERSQWNVKMRRMKLWSSRYTKRQLFLAVASLFFLFYLHFLCLIKMLLAMVYAFGMNEWMIIEFFCSRKVFFFFRSLRSMLDGEQKLWQLINSCGFVSHSKVCLCCFCHLLQHLPSQLIFSLRNSKFLLSPRAWWQQRLGNFSRTRNFNIHTCLPLIPLFNSLWLVGGEESSANKHFSGSNILLH